MRHLVVPEDLSAAEIEAVFAVSRDLQEKVEAGRRDALLPGRVLSEYVDTIVCRSKAHDTIVQLAAVSSVPVINGLSDYCHPCQALADIYTLRQRVGRVAGLTLTFVGDGNNVARSLAILCGQLGISLLYTSPSPRDLSTSRMPSSA